ncbi:T9SS C-terminal target domain-containing protein [Chryseobacterium arthrosphaerae]|uniref:T9SS type A sorting domain-containing protein n=1 Tax=Chryseobacterium arthrosphaerae TaxID=651561 RepID=UPI000F509D80|nr:T9SS type A sorting domain-containing protein [Chryseobacterium arthrosphaerae]AYZ12266.1 T9SS C-terminal target domain-containing protein [Chryseobacterium arthrosphaerae]
MKKYYSIAFLMFSMLFFAQQTISFESDEGFTTGNINGQGAWISTPTGGMPQNVELQTITSEKSSHGSVSLKIVREPVYGTQSEPIIGGFYNLQDQLSSTGFSVSFDISISQFNGSDFGFQAVNSISEQCIARVDFEKTGVLKILNTISGAQNMVSTSGNWSSNNWYRFKAVGTAAGISYYLNGILIYTGSAVPQLTIDQLRFVHNNTSGTAYIDNILVDSGFLMAVKDAETGNKVTLYPNPVIDFIKVTTTDIIEKIEIYDAAGMKMDVRVNKGTVDVRNFVSGVYFMKIKSGKRIITEKFIKR